MEIVRSASKSQMARSASAPGWMVPLRGYSPKIRAGFVANNSTNLRSDSRPFL